MIKSAFFDLDGTLVDTLGNISHCANHIIGSYGYKTHKKEDYKAFIGSGARNLLTLALPDVSAEIFDEIFTVYLKYYEENGFTGSLIYPKISELLNKLVALNIPLFVVSNKPHKAAVAVINHFFPDIPFVEVHGQQEKYPQKPDPFIINMLLAKYNLDRNYSVYIGDSDIDIFTGKSAKMKTIGCSYGFRCEEELISAKADYIVDNAAQIYNILEQI